MQPVSPAGHPNHRPPNTVTPTKINVKLSIADRPRAAIIKAKMAYYEDEKLDNIGRYMHRTDMTQPTFPAAHHPSW